MIMEMQIPQLRELFEARMGQITGVFAEDPPQELGGIEPVMRGLKGFLFALEGMHRSNYLHGLPFTAIQELKDRVDRAVKAIKALPEQLDREQAMGVMRVIDSLHRLCLQENLMAGGMDASKLGKLTVILEHKLGDVLQTLDSVAETGDGHADQVAQTVRDRLAEVQETYNREIEVLQSSASLAAESINSQAETIQKRQTEAIEAFDKLQQELAGKREQFQGRLDEQFAAAEGAVDDVRSRQQAAGELLDQTEEQLSQAKAAINKMAEVTDATEAAEKDLQAKLSESREIIASIRESLTDGAQGAAGVSAKLAEAEQHQGRIEQMLKECQEFATTARQEQTQAVAATKEIADAAERLLHEARQKLDARSEAAEKLLAEIKSSGASAVDAAEQTHQQQQSAEQSARDATENRQQAGEELAQIQDLLARSGQTAGQLDELVRTGCDLKARMEQTLAEAGQSRDRIAQLESAASEATAAIGQGKDEALNSISQAVSQADQQQRQFAKVVSEQRDAAREAVTGLQGDQATAAELLGRTKQDVETLQGEIKQIHDLHSVASDAAGQARAKLDQIGGVVGELGGVVAVASELKTQIDDHLTGTVQTRRRIEQIEQDTAVSVEELLSRQEEAVAAAQNEATAAKTGRLACQASMTEQIESAGAVLGEIRTHKTSIDDFLEQTLQQRDTARQAGQDIAQVRVDTAEACGEIQAKLQEVRGATADLAGLLSASGESRSKIDAELTAATQATGQIGDIRRDMGESLDQARQHTQQLADYKEQSQQLLEQTLQQQDAARQAGQATAQTRAETAEACGEVQAKLQEIRAAAADLSGLLSAGTESRSKIDTELTAATQAAGQIGDIRRDMGKSLDQARKHTQQLSDYSEQSQRLIAEFDSSAQEALGRLEGQTTDLVARNEQLQQEIEDLFGQAADGGLFRQFDDLAEQSAPRRANWLRLLIAGGLGGGVALALVSSIVTAFSVWAGSVVLVAGLAPLAYFLYFCGSQYNAERRVEVQHQYRAALSRSLTAYRKLLAAMKAEGIAESPFVDRMLSTLFSTTAVGSQLPEPAPAVAAELPGAAGAEQDT